MRANRSFGDLVSKLLVTNKGRVIQNENLKRLATNIGGLCFMWLEDFQQGLRSCIADLPYLLRPAVE